MTNTTQLAEIPVRYFEAWGGRDPHALDNFFADRFLWEDPLLPQPVTDLKGAQQFLKGSWKNFSDMRYEMIGGPMIDAVNNRVSQQWRMLATNNGELVPGKPASGNRVDVIGIDVWTVKNGLVTHMRACYDALGLMKQIGGKS